MLAARFEYLALFIGALAFFRGRVEVLEIAAFVVVAAAICEIANYRIRQKIRQWPSDRENAKRVIDALAKNATQDEIMSIEFGRVHVSLVETLRKIASPEIEESLFNDSNLGSSYRYLQGRVRELVRVIDSEMWADSPDFLELPVEWKVYGRPEYQRYREAQSLLLKRSKELIEAIKAFAYCYQGSATRL